MLKVLPLLVLPLVLAGCDMHSNPDTRNDHDVHISVRQDDNGSGGHVSLNIPGFDGKFSIPTFFMKNGHMDIDGLKLAPDTVIHGIDILGNNKGGDDKNSGNIHMTFSNPKTPADLAAYYRQAAQDAGYTISPLSGDAGLIATKARKKVTVSLTGDNGGSRGAIDVIEG